jgi:pimeloyl-ACP methyl ester carboxylesterase
MKPSLLDVGDERIVSFQTWGPVDGEPVFLMHGTPGSRLGPRPGDDILDLLGVRLICCDRPGYGGSDPLFGRTVAHVAGDTAKVADHLGIGTFSVLGRSGGGPHALACAALLPDRVRAVAALVSLAPYGARGLDWFAGMGQDNVAEFRAAQLGPDALAQYLKPIAEEICRNPDGSVPCAEHTLPESDRLIASDPAILEMFRENFAEALRHSATGWIDDDLSFLRSWGFDVADIRLPTRLWHGAHDVFSPVGHSRWLAEQIAGAQLDVDEKHGHLGSLHVMPELLDRLLTVPR